MDGRKCLGYFVIERSHQGSSEVCPAQQSGQRYIWPRDGSINRSSGWSRKIREGRLRLYGDMTRKGETYTGRKVLKIDLTGKRRRGRPRKRYMDVIKEDMEAMGQGEEDMVDRRAICGGDP